MIDIDTILSTIKILNPDIDVSEQLKSYNDIKANIDAKTEKFKNTIDDINKQISDLGNKYKNNSKPYIERKRKQLNERKEKLQNWFNDWKKTQEQALDQWATKVGDNIKNELKKANDYKLEQLNKYKDTKIFKAINNIATDINEK